MYRWIAFLMLLAAPALAQSQEDVLSARILQGWRMDSGNYMAALDLQLAPEWKTYWRAPGEAGIAPVFDWSGSVNLRSVQFHWPSPQVIVQNGLTSIGYEDELVLPVEVVPLDPGLPVVLDLQMDLGICHDICMPASLQLDMDLTGPGPADARIAAALAAAPEQAKSATCQVAPIADGVKVTARIDLPPQPGDEVVIFETPDPQVWVAEAESNREGQLLMAQTDFVPPSGAPFALDLSGITLTVLSPGHSVEIKGCPAP